MKAATHKQDEAEAPKRKAISCPKCGMADAPVHKAPDGVARIGEHGHCEGQGMGV